MTRSERANEKNDAWFAGEAFHGCGLDPEFEEIAKEFLLGDVENRGCLTDVQRALVTVAALTATQSLQHMGQYLRAGLRMGATAEQLRETIYQCAPYVGLERALCALEAASPVLMECDGDAVPNTRVTEADRFDKGLAVQRQLFGAGNIDNMRESAPAELRHIQDYLSVHCFGDFYTRGGLDLPTRELITFCAICCLGGLRTSGHQPCGGQSEHRQRAGTAHRRGDPVPALHRLPPHPQRPGLHRRGLPQVRFLL